MRASLQLGASLCAGAVLLLAPAAYGAVKDDLTQLSLEDLGNVQVTSVSKKPQALSETADAIFVVTHDDIIRSGATTLPDALRLVPGVQVAQIDANKWAIGIRGFASRLSRSLLVLIDGRSVYTPLFAGVYWEVQDLPLDDIDRIEVIRGPGGTLWGANAVNGVINIITKPAGQTRGGLVRAAAGTEDEGLVTVRYGGSLGSGTNWRAYGKWTERNAGFHSDSPEFDDWHKTLGGFRVDSVISGTNTLTVQGDAYDGQFGELVQAAEYSPPSTRTVIGDAHLSGQNLLGRWGFTHGRADSSLQAYFDRVQRDEVHFAEDRNTFDLDWQQRIRDLPGGHDLVWGAGYRLSRISTDSKFASIHFDPASKNEDVVSAFVQDELKLGRDFHLSAGSKFEHNDYSGFEVQPSVRFSWAPSRRQDVLWVGVSRAVRTPTRTDTDLTLDFNLVPGSPVFGRVRGTHDFQAERVLAYQAGYRFLPMPWLSLDITGFYNDYKRLLSLETAAPFTESAPPPPHTIVPLLERNLLEGRTYGGELLSRIDLSHSWRLAVTYSLLRMSLFPESASTDTSQLAVTGNSPHHQVVVWSSLSLPAHIELDTIARYVGQLPAQQVPQYTELDTQVSWKPRERLTLSLIGRNLLHDHHPEFGLPQFRVEVERGVSGRVTWAW